LRFTTVANLLAARVYVAFGSSHPDKETVKEVKKKLQDLEIDVSRLADWSANHCQPAESTTDG
jgi:hypothetical protein